MTSLLDTLTLCHTFLPRLQVGELINVNTRPACSSNPTPVGNIGNGNMVANQVSRLGLSKVLVKNAVQSAGLIHIAVDAVLDFLWGIAGEVVCLALHGANTCVLEEEPVGHLVVLTCALGERNLVVGVVLLHQILQDAARLEQADLLAVGELVCQSWDTAIGVDLEEPAVDGSAIGLGRCRLVQRHILFFLYILAHINLLDLVGQSDCC